MIAIIDYGAGNVASVANALKEITADFVVTKRETDICKSDKIILPGVGEASFAMKQLNLVNISNLFRLIKKPLLGICLGAQLMCDKSEEGNVPCLGVFPLTVTEFKLDGLKIPHMGWNQVSVTKPGKLFEGISNGENFYFAHSFYIPDSEYTTSKCTYGVEFASSIEKNNFYGVQFHPEKSGRAGMKLLKNFVELC
jgi:imidazole glycerol-phosphate synthase subunit HisH